MRHATNNIMRMNGKHCKGGMTEALSVLLIMILLLSASGVQVFAESAETGNTPALQILARPLKDSILLRWAPTNFETWDLGNRYGYKLERFTLIRNDQLLSEPEFTQLPTDELQPLPLEKWESLIGVRFAMIAAQAIYGDSFVLEAGEDLTPQKAFDLAEEQQQRFSFALYAADMSPTVARASGLWFADKQAKANEMYLYRVILNLPDTLSIQSDTAFVFTGISDFTPLPKPYEFSVEFGDRIAFLSWNTFVHEDIYAAWIIERSGNNGRTYTTTKEDPFIPFTPSEQAFAEFAVTSDSLPDNTREYLYRIRGVNIFGESGPWSDIVRGRGKTTMDIAPNFYRYELVRGSVVLHWDFPPDENRSLAGFRILRSDRADGKYDALSSSVKPADRQYRDTRPIETAYYKVVAFRADQEERQSFPFLVQQTDSIPPARPVGLKGQADSTGIVYLSWTPNTDPDIYGYRIFWSASGRDEFSQITNEPVITNEFTDTVSMRDLNEHVFYKLFAVDQRQNRSEFSDVLRVTKPDLIPPSPPVFKGFSATSRGVEISWHNSSSSDAAVHIIYRSEGTDDWEMVSEFPVRTNQRTGSFLDTGISKPGIVRYMLVAEDRSGNRSEPALSPDIMQQGRVDPGSIQLTRQSSDIRKGEIILGWSLPERGIRHIRIYRESGDNGYTLHETLPPDAESFRDYGLRAGTRYKYRIQLVFDNGEFSRFSNEIMVRM
jgi:uncharacterized protein